MRAAARIECTWQRMHAVDNLASNPAPYLLSIDVPDANLCGVVGFMPQARAVVDDFGTLVIVRGWR